MRSRSAAWRPRRSSWRAPRTWPELLRHLVLRFAGGLEERAQAEVGRADEQALAAERDLEAAEHGAAVGAAERGEGPGHPAGGLAARRIDQAERVAGDEHADLDGGLRVAQQPVELLVRCRLPVLLLAAAVGVELRAEHYEQLRRAVGSKHCPIRRDVGLTLRHRDGEGVGQLRATRRTRHTGGRPAEDGLKERPWVGQDEVGVVRDRRFGVEQQSGARSLGIFRPLPRRIESVLAQHVAAQNQAVAAFLDVGEPFRGRIVANVARHRLLRQLPGQK
jgi:hypothetical protein